MVEWEGEGETKGKQPKTNQAHERAQQQDGERQSEHERHASPNRLLRCTPVCNVSSLLCVCSALLCHPNTPRAVPGCRAWHASAAERTRMHTRQAVASHPRPFSPVRPSPSLPPTTRKGNAADGRPLEDTQTDVSEQNTQNTNEAHMQTKHTVIRSKMRKCFFRLHKALQRNLDVTFFFPSSLSSNPCVHASISRLTGTAITARAGHLGMMSKSIHVLKWGGELRPEKAKKTTRTAKKKGWACCKRNVGAKEGVQGQGSAVREVQGDGLSTMSSTIGWLLIALRASPVAPPHALRVRRARRP
jgi:hypothetical protein